jgi:hypothetical protein
MSNVLPALAGWQSVAVFDLTDEQRLNEDREHLN